MPKASTVFGYNDDRKVTAAFDDPVLVMPSRLLQKGESAVWFGRFVTTP
ncbi:MAG: hypothetical protein JSU82_04115 [Rhodospirillales bacterium]|nr:MAG: hypothetical protein JSU82_04115 [Rhodospirillales bacterium]